MKKINMELEVDRSQWLDPELMRGKDILIFLGEDKKIVGKEIVCPVGKDYVQTFGMSDGKSFERRYPISDGILFLNDFTTTYYGKETLFHYDIGNHFWEVLL